MEFVNPKMQWNIINTTVEGKPPECQKNVTVHKLFVSGEQVTWAD